MLQRRSLAALAVVASSLALGVSSIARADEPAAPNPTPPPNAAGANANAKPPLIPAEVDPAKDASTLEKQGDPTAPMAPKGVLGTSGATFSEDWWKHTRPIVEIHGFFRTRAELFHNFSLGRVDSQVDSPRLFPRPLDDSYTDNAGVTHNVLGCSATADIEQKTPCTQKTNASANMRFRIDPEIHISDNLRIMTQIDMLDNLVLGSTPEGYTNSPGTNGYQSNGRGGYVPLTSFSSTQVPPQAGVNSYTNSIAVKRVWGEYTTPVGQVRFGRMPSSWGLGILVNSGDRIDSDYQTTADRILFVTGSKALDLYVAGAWDFPNTGRTSAYGDPTYQQGQPYNTTQLANTAQWVFAIFRRVRPEIMNAKLAKGDVVVNGGMYSVYRQQILANESSTNNGLATQPESYQTGLVRVGAKAFIPDLWLQVLTKRLRWETELVYV